MKKTYIKPLCEAVRIENDITLLAGSPNVTVTPGTGNEYEPGIEPPEYGDEGEEVPEESKFNLGYDIWGDEF